MKAFSIVGIVVFVLAFTVRGGIANLFGLALAITTLVNANKENK